MEVITLDDTADTSLFVFDSTPILDQASKIGRANKKRKLEVGTNKNKKKQKKNGYVVLGGTIQDNSPIQTPKPNRKRRKTSVETIVIDDDDDNGSVIEVSDDERVGVIGGLLSGSMESIQKKIKNFQRLRVRHNIQIKNNNTQKKTIQGKLPEHEKIPYHCPKTPGTSAVKPTKPRKLRPIVIDGSNVAFGHGNHTEFSSKGIEICYEYFKKRGHTVKVFLPQFRRRHPSTKDTHILDKLEKEKVIVFTPSRKINGKMVVSYDDRMMLDYASQCGGIVVTRDGLRDLLDENDAFKEIVNERLLMYTWVDEDIILFPQDPLGRKGPTLDNFLSFPEEEKEETKENT